MKPINLLEIDETIRPFVCWVIFYLGNVVIRAYEGGEFLLSDGITTANGMGQITVEYNNTNFQIFHKMVEKMKDKLQISICYHKNIKELTLYVDVKGKGEDVKNIWDEVEREFFNVVLK